MKRLLSLSILLILHNLHYCFGQNNGSESESETPIKWRRKVVGPWCTDKTKDQPFLLIGGITHEDSLTSYLNGDWTTKSSIPLSLEHPTVSLSLDNEVVVVGGRNGSNENATFIYNADEDVWKPGPFLNLGRYRHSSVIIGNFLYVFAGYNLQDGFLGTVEYMDLKKGVNSKWKNLTPMKKTRAGAAAVVWKGDVYVGGGQRINYGKRNWIVTSSVEKYITREDRWEKIPDMLKPRMDHSFVTLQGKIYAIGGRATSATLKSCESFDGKRWKVAPSMNIERQGPAVFVFEEKIYVVGGAKVAELTQFVHSIEVFDTTSNRWILEVDSAAPWPIYHSSIVVLNPQNTLTENESI